METPHRTDDAPSFRIAVSAQPTPYKRRRSILLKQLTRAVQTRSLPFSVYVWVDRNKIVMLVFLLPHLQNTSIIPRGTVSFFDTRANLLRPLGESLTTTSHRNIISSTRRPQFAYRQSHPHKPYKMFLKTLCGKPIPYLYERNSAISLGEINEKTPKTAIEA